MIQAVLSNPAHPEYGVATIPFPIPHGQYAHCMELLEALEIGDAVKADCKVEKFDSFYTVLKRVEMLTVNVEELNYLAKRLDKLTEQLRAAKQAKSRILNQDGDDTIPCTQELITILKRGPETLHDFDGELFGQLIDKVIIERNTSLRFRLKNGLELRESIERTVR